MVYQVTDFVAICNQVLEVAFGSIQISGELASFKVSKNKWLFFNIKDQYSSLRCFGTVNELPGPLEDGMTVIISGTPKLHPKYGFSVTVQSIRLSGEGSIKKAQVLLEQKLAKEGLFDTTRKRTLPFAPTKVGLISSSESAGYTDFMKIVNERWSGLEIKLIDVLVQGEDSPKQIIQAVDYFNQHHPEIEVLVITRGGGGDDDLQTFNHEGVVRAISASRILTMVAIGHEKDVTLAERVADVRASTPSNCAQLLVPDKLVELEKLLAVKDQLEVGVLQNLAQWANNLQKAGQQLSENTFVSLQQQSSSLALRSQILEAFNPTVALKRGYAILRLNNRVIKSVRSLRLGQMVGLELYDGQAEATITSIAG